MKNKAIQILILLFIPAIVISQDALLDTIYLWPNKVSGEIEAKHAPENTGNTKGNVLRLTNVTNPSLIVFQPKKSNSKGAGIIICPGGGYSILAVDKEGYEIALWLNKLGYTAFVLNYRVPNKQEGALNDIQRAIRVIRSRMGEFHLNQEKLGIMGFSAGGSLCARASTQFSEDSYQKTDDIYGNSALVMTTVLRDNHVPVELHFLNKGGHGY